eukprot:gene11698-12917_t
MIKNKNPPIPESGYWKLTESCCLQEVMTYGKTWLESIKQGIMESPPAMLSWSAYHGMQQNDLVVLKSISSVLPLLKEDSHSVALMCNSIKLVQKLTAFLNPGQPPVMTFDQPLYAIAKTIQWTWPEQFGEEKLVVMLGGLHIEMAFISLIGSWLKDSGWIQALEEGGVMTSGRAAAILQCSHVKRSRYAHEVSAAALYALLRHAHSLQNGPQISALTEAFKRSIAKPQDRDDAAKHHEETISFQKRYTLDVCNLRSTLTEFGNPFLEESTDSLIVLHTGNIRQGLAVANLEKIEEVGRKQFEEFVTQRLLEREVSLSETISRNKLSIFNSPKVQTKQHQLVTSLKNDVALFSRLFIACQNRDGNIEEFFRHENQSSPPSISQNNELRSGNKADLLHQLESMDDSISSCEPPEVEVKVIDGAALINGLKPPSNTTFEDYASKTALPRLKALSANALRIDVVFDVYLERSLKNSARVHRGQGARRPVKGNLQVSSDWKSFLRHSDNKTELFSHLAQFIHESLRLDGKTSIAFGSGQHFRYINVNKIAVLLGEEKACALPMFHAFTGCDTSASHAASPSHDDSLAASITQLTATVAALTADQKELRAAFTPPHGPAPPQRQSRPPSSSGNFRNSNTGFRGSLGKPIHKTFERAFRNRQTSPTTVIRKSPSSTKTTFTTPLSRINVYVNSSFNLSYSHSRQPPSISRQHYMHHQLNSPHCITVASHLASLHLIHEYHDDQLERQSILRNTSMKAPLRQQTTYELFRSNIKRLDI